MFLHVSVIHSVHGGRGGVCSKGSKVVSQHALRQTPQSRHPPKEQTPPRRRACCEIRSTRGRYASYWNAILLLYRLCYGSNVCGKRDCHVMLAAKTSAGVALRDESAESIAVLKQYGQMRVLMFACFKTKTKGRAQK